MGRATLMFAAMVMVGAGAAAGPAERDVGTARAGPGAVAAPSLLHLGSHGPRVVVLQRRLVALRYLPTGAANGRFGMRTWHAVVAFQGWRRIHRDGVVGARTRAALASARRAVPWIRLEHGLELDLERQVLLVVAGGNAVRAVHVSSARPGYVTPRGRFEVYRRERRSWSVRYRVWMPYAL